MFDLEYKKHNITEAQLGWNCFDIAINLAYELNITASSSEELSISARKELVRRSLEHRGNIQYRKLLAPEIRHAAALTVSYMLDQEENDGSKEKILLLNELFLLREDLDEEDEDIQLSVEHQIHELLKTENTTKFSKGLLPDFMRTEELRQIVLEYLSAHENMKSSVDACNDALGFVDGERQSIQELDDYFSSIENQQLNQEIFSLYQTDRDKILSVRERNFSEFCEREETYINYLNGYYGNNEWVAFQRNFADENNTSMVDIIAHIINKEIIIYDSMNEIIYSTINNDAIDKVSVQYNGHNHFISYQPELSMSPFFHDSDGYVFHEGSLSEAVDFSVSKKEPLTFQEKTDISESKKILLDLIKELKFAKEKYKENLLKKNDFILVFVQTQLMNLCKELTNKAIEYIEFLSNKASVLLKHRCYSQAEDEFKVTLDFAHQIFGQNTNKFEALHIQLDYGICQLSINVELGRDIIEQTLEKLKQSQGNENDIKMAIAIGNYQLAQYHFLKGNFNKSEDLLIQSKQLREECGASQEELNKINFLFAKIHSVKGDKNKAETLLINRYAHLKSQNEFNIELIPIIEELCEIFSEKRNVGEEMKYLTHLLAIKKHISLDERQIISTKLRMLRVMVFVVSEEEYLDVMNEIEASLFKIPVTKEDVAVGLNYLELADARMSTFCPPRWSNVKKREYFSQTLAIIGKAKNHLKMKLIENFPLLIINPNGIKEKLDDLTENCLMSIRFFEDPAAVPRLIDQPLHPEDEAEILLSASCGIESNTERELRELSEFSSEIDYQLLYKPDSILTIEEFEQLPNTGEINPYRLRAAQGGYNLEFRDGKSLQDTEQSLIDNPSYTKNIPPIEIGIYCGKIYSFDTRRLIIHQQAKEKNPSVFIRYKKISGHYLQERVDAIFSPRPWNGLVTAARYGGKNSESVPYINPLVRTQLEEKVSAEFKRFPSGRKNADPNGFPNIKLKAKKIHEFFQEKSEQGSENARKVLREAEYISQSEGKKSAWMFLISQKKDDKQSEAFNELR